MITAHSFDTQQLAQSWPDQVCDFSNAPGDVLCVAFRF